MERKLFYIYECKAKRLDKSKLERTIKIPAHWNYELLSMALVSTCDCPGVVDSIEILHDGVKTIIDKYTCRSVLKGVGFDEFAKSDMDITINYLDDISITFICKRIEIEESIKQIDRKTPILLSASGFSRVGKTKKISKADYLKNEENNVNNLEKVLKTKFTKIVSYFFD